MVTAWSVLPSLSKVLCHCLLLWMGLNYTWSLCPILRDTQLWAPSSSPGLHCAGLSPGVFSPQGSTHEGDLNVHCGLLSKWLFLYIFCKILSNLELGFEKDTVLVHMYFKKQHRDFTRWCYQVMPQEPGLFPAYTACSLSGRGSLTQFLGP